MSKAIALSRSTYAVIDEHSIEALRSVIVLACGAALIFAGAPLPL
ncbi:hypothetical protein [Erythrobacter sp.]|jgi:hypothetical protein|nr:hypothetical protein [Erythrobacter sp.]